LHVPEAAPSHGLPPHAGAGFVHVRECVPPPHVAVHVLYADHPPWATGQCAWQACVSVWVARRRTGASVDPPPSTSLGTTSSAADRSSSASMRSLRTTPSSWFSSFLLPLLVSIVAAAVAVPLPTAVNRR